MVSPIRERVFLHPKKYSLRLHLVAEGPRLLTYSTSLRSNAFKSVTQNNMLLMKKSRRKTLGKTYPFLLLKFDFVSSFR